MMLRAALLLACLWSAAGIGAPLQARDLAAVRAAADAGSAVALFDLGRMVRNGVGVAPDSERAFALVQQAARGGHPPAMFTLNNMLAAGEGAERDEAQARYWLEQAAAREHPEALQQLAMNLQHGAMGYPRDERRAAQLLAVMAHALKHAAHPH